MLSPGRITCISVSILSRFHYPRQYEHDHKRHTNPHSHEPAAVDKVRKVGYHVTTRAKARQPMALPDLSLTTLLGTTKSSRLALAATIPLTIYNVPGFGSAAILNRCSTMSSSGTCTWPRTMPIGSAFEYTRS